MPSKKITVLIAAAAGIALLGIAVALLWPGRPEGGSDRAAQIMPEKVAILIWSAPLGEMLDFTAEIGLSSDLLSTIAPEYAAAIGQLGFDPLVPAELSAHGVDLEQPLALGVVPEDHSGGLALFFLPTVPGADSTGLIGSLQENLSPLRGTFVEDAEREHPVLWVHPGTGEPVAGAVVLLEEGFVVLLPLDPEPGKPEEVAAELKLAVSQLLDPEVKRLAHLPGYSKAVAGSGGSIAGLYLNPSAAAEFLGPVSASALGLGGLANVQGAAAFIAVAGQKLTATGRVVGPEGEDSKLFTKRDSSVFEVIPGPPGIGLHVALSAPEVVATIEGLLVGDDRTWEQYQGQKEVALRTLQLPTETELHQLWDGEIGLFVSELTPSPELMLNETVAFIGLDDLGRVKGAVLTIAKLVGKERMTETMVGNATAWNITYGGLTMGLMVHRGKLWFGGNLANLEAIEEGIGDKGHIGPREEEMTRGMREANGGAMYADLAAIMEHLPGVLSRGQQERLKPLSSLMSKLDYLTWRGDVEGNIATGKLSLSVDSQSLRELIVEIAAAQLTGSSGGRKDGSSQ